MYALAGIRIADFTTMIAGTFATQLLADMGADVIKIEPLDGEPWRRMGMLFLGTNRGKRDLALDIRQPEGREILHRLVATADVFVENARVGVTQRAGLDYESLVRIRPDIIYVSVLGHGSSGPYATAPGYDPLLQARSGMMAAQGGPGKPPVFMKVAVNDLAAPMLAAYAIVLALYHRKRTGEGQRIETSLTNAAVVMQSGDFLDYPGATRRVMGDADRRGAGATWRLYETADEWIFVVCASDGHWRELCRVIGREELLTDRRFVDADRRRENDEPLAETLAGAFRTRPAARWIADLKAAGVPCARQFTLEEVMADPHFLQTQVLVDHDYPDWGRVRQPGLVPRLSKTPGRIQRPAPPLGMHNGPILLELGYSFEEITALFERKIIS